MKDVLVYVGFPSQNQVRRGDIVTVVGTTPLQVMENVFWLYNAVSSRVEPICWHLLSFAAVAMVSFCALGSLQMRFRLSCSLTNLCTPLSSYTSHSLLFESFTAQVLPIVPLTRTTRGGGW